MFPRLRPLVFASLAVLFAGCDADRSLAPGKDLSFEPRFAKAPADPTSQWKLPLQTAGLGLISDGRLSDGTYSVYADGVCGVTGRVFLGGSGDATLQTDNPRVRSQVCQTFRTMTVVYPVGDPVYPGGGTETSQVFVNLRNIANASTTIGLGYANRVERLFVVNPNQATRCDALKWGSGQLASGVVLNGDNVWVERLNSTTYHIYTKDLDPVAGNRIAGANKATCASTGQLHHLSVDLMIVANQPLP